MGKGYQDEETLRELYLEQDKTLSEIAEKYDVSYDTIRRWRDKFGITKQEPHKDKDTLRELYIEQNMTLAEVGDEIDVHKNTIKYWVNKFELEKEEGAYETGPPVSESELRRLYWEEMMSQTEIGEQFDVTQGAVKNWMKEYGIEARGPGGAPNPPASRERLYELYVKQGLSTRQLPEHIDATRRTISRWIDRFGIEKHPIGGRKRDQVDDDQLQRLYADEGYSQAQIANKLDVDVNQTTVSRWLRDIGVDVENQAGWGQLVETERGETVKSALERAVADWLYEHNIDYEYEPELDGTDFVPDFRADGVLIEAWGIRQLDRYDERREEKLETYDELEYDVVSVYPELSDGPGVDEVLANVAWQTNLQITKN